MCVCYSSSVAAKNQYHDDYDETDCIDRKHVTFCYRDLMLAGTQQSVELKLALDQEQLKSKKLEESMRKLDEEMKRTDELLYQMIPKQVADRLRNGESPIDTCEVRAML